MSEVGQGRIVIAGGGPVGLTMALALQRRGWDPTVLEVKTTATDSRLLAISLGSAHILQWLGVWEKLATHPITQVAVHQLSSEARSLGHTTMEGAPLGVTVRAAELLRVLSDEVSLRKIHLLPGPALAWRDNEVHYGVAESPARLPADLLIWAHGQGPRKLEQGPRKLEQGPWRSTSDDYSGRTYDQQVMVCDLQIDRPAQGAAWELLVPQGLLVLLPEGDHLALIVMGTAAFIEEKMKLDATAFCAWLRRYTDAVAQMPVPLTCSRRQIFAHSLQLHWRRKIIAPRQVWIGNAAQHLHPIGAQGLNLALRDVWELAEALPISTADAGAEVLLRRYARGRLLDRLAIITTTDLLARLAHRDGLQRLRAAGLTALQRLPQVKSFLLHRMVWGARNYLPDLLPSALLPERHGNHSRIL